jgi:2-haloacid dehalogenase
MTVSSSIRCLILASCLSLVSVSSHGQAQSQPRFKAAAFDYFVIFDANSVVPEVESEFPGKGVEFTRLWRAKQFEYCYLRSITDRHADFFKVTEDAMVYAAEAMKLNLSPQARRHLLDAYLTLKPWPDAVDALRKLKASGLRIITISNFTPNMLRANAEHAGIADLFDDLLSTEVNGSYKPDPRAYALGTQTLGLEKNEIVFAAFGAWDAYGAKSFGYPTYWVNRFNVPAEQLDMKVDGSSADMQGMLDFVLRKGK